LGLKGKDVMGGWYILADGTSERANVNNQCHSGHAASERERIAVKHPRKHAWIEGIRLSSMMRDPLRVVNTSLPFQNDVRYMQFPLIPK